MEKLIKPQKTIEKISNEKIVALCEHEGYNIWPCDNCWDVHDAGIEDDILF